MDEILLTHDVQQVEPQAIEAEVAQEVPEHGIKVKDSLRSRWNYRVMGALILPTAVMADMAANSGETITASLPEVGQATVLAGMILSLGKLVLETARDTRISQTSPSELQELEKRPRARPLQRIFSPHYLGEGIMDY